MILQAAELAIQPLLQAAIDDVTETEGTVPVIILDPGETKPPMPYIVVECSNAEEEITPGSGIFKVDCSICFYSHTKQTSPEERQAILDGINNFAYDQTATKLSLTPKFHCHGWRPTTAGVETDNDRKSINHILKYEVHCMQMDQ